MLVFKCECTGMCVLVNLEARDGCWVSCLIALYLILGLVRQGLSPFQAEPVSLASLPKGSSASISFAVITGDLSCLVSIYMGARNLKSGPYTCVAK